MASKPKKIRVAMVATSRRALHRGQCFHKQMISPHSQMIKPAQPDDKPATWTRLLGTFSKFFRGAGEDQLNLKRLLEMKEKFNLKILEAQDLRKLMETKDQFHMKLLEAKDVVLEAKEGAFFTEEKLLLAKDQIIHMYKQDILRLELELIQARSTNLLRGVFELLENKLEIPVSVTSRYERWSLFLENDEKKEGKKNALVTKLMLLTKKKRHEVVSLFPAMYTTLSGHVHDGKHQAAKALRMQNGTGNVSRYPLTEQEASILNAVAQQLGLNLEIG